MSDKNKSAEKDDDRDAPHTDDPEGGLVLPDKWTLSRDDPRTKELLKPSMTVLVKVYFRDPTAGTPLLVESNANRQLTTVGGYPENITVRSVGPKGWYRPLGDYEGRASMIMINNNSNSNPVLDKDSLGSIEVSFSPEKPADDVEADLVVPPGSCTVLDSPVPSRVWVRCVGDFTFGQFVTYPV